MIILDEHAEMLIRRIEGAERHPPVGEWEWKQEPEMSATMAAGRLYGEITSAFPEMAKLDEMWTLPTWVHVIGYVSECYRKHFPEDTCQQGTVRATEITL